MGTTITTELVHHGERRDALGRRHLPSARRRELLALFRESGLTRQAFARREGIRYTTFCTWVQRAQKTPAPAAAPATTLRPRFPRAQAAAAASAMRFTEVALPPGAAGTYLSLEVRLPDGTTLRGKRAESLAALIRALRA
jgi:transposase-like protein